MTSSKTKNTNNYPEYEISGFTEYDINIIHNYTIPKNLKTITQPNAIGTVIHKDTNKIMGNITPLIMVINAKRTMWREAVAYLVQIGADPDMMIEYYGRQTSAREIANTYRGGFP